MLGGHYDGLPATPQERSPSKPWIVVGHKRHHRRRREQRQKRGCRGGLLARLRKQPYKSPLPSIFVTNARSIVHKTGELELLMANNQNIRDCSVMIITETWLHPLIPDSAVQLTGHSMHRFNRNKGSGKSRGGGLYSCSYGLVYKQEGHTHTLLS